MPFRRLFVRSSSSLLAFVLSIAFASFAHAGTLPIDVVNGKPSGGGSRGSDGIYLVGNDVIPGPGDLAGVVTGTISFKRDQVSFAFQVTSLTGQITHIGIYRGGLNVSGSELIVLDPMPSGIMALRGTVTADPAIVRQISSDKAHYYVMITTDAYPGGAVRAQLASL